MMDYDVKQKFHAKWLRLLRKLATQDLGLARGTFDVRSNKAGPAILGEVTLHTDTLYLHIGGSICTAEKPDLYYRSCKGRKDYHGGRNRWDLSPDTLENDRPRAIELLRAAITEGYER
jgi:hypothetical protein